MRTKIKREQTVSEEIANAVTHGLGTLLSIAALVILVVSAAKTGDPWRIVSAAIFGTSLIVLYLMSILYHSIKPGTLKDFFHKLDHIAIYILIAGSYTPVLLVNLRDSIGWSIFGIIWGLALIGTLFKLKFTGRFTKISTIVYIVMGWLVVAAVKPLIDALSSDARMWLFAGGLSYTLGTVFYAWKKMPFQHAVWHVFVLGGSVCHFFAIMHSIA